MASKSKARRCIAGFAIGAMAIALPAHADDNARADKIKAGATYVSKGGTPDVLDPALSDYFQCALKAGLGNSDGSIHSIDDIAIRICGAVRATAIAQADDILQKQGITAPERRSEIIVASINVIDAMAMGQAMNTRKQLNASQP